MPDSKPPPPCEPAPVSKVQQLGKVGALLAIAHLLKPNIVHLFNFATCCKAAFAAVGSDYALWREVYVTNEPLAPKNFKKRLLKDTYCNHKQLLGKPGGLQFSVWMRTCCLLFRKPRLVLVLGGKDPVLVRRLGQSEGLLQRVHLGINYHLDSYLDEDESRFAVEFPQLFQDLDTGDIVVTQDYRGAGCWTVFPPGTPLPKAPPRPQLQDLLPTPPWQTPPPAPVPPAAGSAAEAAACFGRLSANLLERGYSVLKKNEYDSSGYGILTDEVAPPTYPLFYFCEEVVQGVRAGGLDRAKLAAKQVYWFGYSRLKDGALFSWGDLQICEEE